MARVRSTFVPSTAFDMPTPPFAEPIPRWRPLTPVRGVGRPPGHRTPVHGCHSAAPVDVTAPKVTLRHHLASPHRAVPRDLRGSCAPAAGVPHRERSAFLSPLPGWRRPHGAASHPVPSGGRMDLSPHAVSWFWSRVDRGSADDCWEWTGARRSDGYGRFHPFRHGPSVGAHRFSFTLHCGPIPSGLFVLHTCDNRACVRPDHLFVGTNLDNVRDMFSKGRQSLRHGEFAGRARLTEVNVRDIRQRNAEGVGARTLAREFGVSRRAVQQAIQRKTWRHL